MSVPVALVLAAVSLAGCIWLQAARPHSVSESMAAVVALAPWFALLIALAA